MSSCVQRSASIGNQVERVIEVRIGAPPWGLVEHRSVRHRPEPWVEGSGEGE
jgi:hypothetical protein